MRRIVLAGLAACAGPTGVTQSWPPSLGVTIAAATFADLDGDGALDIAIAATGSVAGEGLYLVKGDVDWDGTAISSFSRFVPHALADVAALEMVSGSLVLVYTVKGTATLEVLDPETLATRSKLPLAIASAQHLVATTIDFPGMMPHAVIVGDDDVVHDDVANSADGSHEVPPPVGTGPKWPQPQTATGFGTGEIAIATPTQVYTAMLMAGFAYATVRPATDTVPLTAQIAATLSDKTGAPITAIVGVDVAGSRLCAIDVADATGAACVAISIPANARLHLISGALDDKPGTEVAIVAAAAAMGNAAILTYTNVVLDGAVLTTGGLIGGMGGLGTPVELASPIVTIVPQTPVAPSHLFALGLDGETACLGMAGC